MAEERGPFGSRRLDQRHKGSAPTHNGAEPTPSQKFSDPPPGDSLPSLGLPLPPGWVRVLHAPGGCDG